MTARLVAAWTVMVALLAAGSGTARAQAPDEHQAMMSAAGAPTMVFRAFGSIDWGVSQRPDRPSSFTIGQFDMFLTSTLNEHVSVLAEAVLEASTNTRVVIDLERLELTYTLNDYFRVSAGRYHTGIGFYNAAFHHAAFFETAVGRPRVYRFEDEGGVLPVHEVGLTAHGVVPKTRGALHYLAEVGNGRRWSDPSSDAPEGLDDNTAKATNVGLSYKPDSWRGVEVGVSYYRDSIPRPEMSAVSHHITAVYGTYRTPPVEILAEYLWLLHDADGERFHNDATYVQASRAWGKLRPYYRYDRQTIDPRTPFIGALGSYKAQLVGLRIDPSALVGLKIEYRRADEDGWTGVDALRTQVVFVF